MSWATLGWIADHVGPRCGTSSALAAALLIGKHTDDYHVAYPSQSRLADRMPIGRQAVNAAVAKLTDGGFVDVHHFRDRYGHLQCVYRFRVPTHTRDGDQVLTPVGRDVVLPDGVRFEDLPEQWRTPQVLDPDDPCRVETTGHEANAPDAPHGPPPSGPDHRTGDTAGGAQADTGARRDGHGPRGDPSNPVENPGPQSPPRDKATGPSHLEATEPSRVHVGPLSPPRGSLVASTRQEYPRTPGNTNPLPADAGEKTSSHQELFAAIAAACHLEDNLTGSAAAVVGKVAKQLAQVAATPDQVAARTSRLRDRWGDKAVTPTSLAKHWPTLGPPRQSTDDAGHDGATTVARNFAGLPWDDVESMLLAAGHDPDAVDAAREAWNLAQDGAAA